VSITIYNSISLQALFFKEFHISGSNLDTFPLGVTWLIALWRRGGQNSPWARGKRLVWTSP